MIKQLLNGLCFIILISSGYYIVINQFNKVDAQLSRGYMGDFEVDGEIKTLTAIAIKEASAPGTDTNTGKLYVATDNSLHFLSEEGTDTQVVDDTGVAGGGGTGGITDGAPNPYVTDSTDEFSVGTPTQTAKLHVRNEAAQDSFRVEDDTADPDLTPFVIDQSGNVGVGTPTPSVKLDVKGTVKAEGFESVLTSGQKGYIRLGEDPDNGTEYIGHNAPASIAASYDLIWPNADAAGAVMSDGAGNLNYTDVITEAELSDESELETQITDMANIIQETEIDSFSELDTLVSDKTLASSDSANTFTNKSVDANGTGNAYTNFDEDNMLNGSDIVLGALEFGVGSPTAFVENVDQGIYGEVEVPYNCTIKAARIFLDVSGSCTADLWVDDFASYPPTDADSICGTNTLSTGKGTDADQIKIEDLTLDSWTTSLSAGDIIRYNIDHGGTFTRFLISLTVEK